MKEIRSLEIWFINNTYYLQAYSVSIDGIRYTSNNPVYVLDVNEQKTLGEKVLSTVNECKFGVPNPPLRDNTDRKQFHALLGVKSEKELMKKGLSLSVFVDDDKVEISPLFFDGKAMSYAKEDLSSSIDPEEITRTVLKAFERCHP